MNEIRGEVVDGKMVLHLSGRVDSNNAQEVEKVIFAFVGEHAGAVVEVDASVLEYISSAGLRILLHLRKDFPKLKITGVNAEVYNILEMTGFTEMMNVEKAYRVVSVEGCEEIGRGANGTIYRIDQDNVVKVYNNPEALADIQNEREMARLALILGIPTAISYDVVRVGDSYGSVFELLNASSFAKILATEPEKMDWCVKEYVEMLKKIHGTLVPAGKLSDMKQTVLDYVNFLKDYMPEEVTSKLQRMVEEIPHDDHMMHGDYHIKNLELQGDEVLLIDMDTLAVGHPIFELGFMYNAYVGFSEANHENVKGFLGIDFETSQTFWRKSLAAYLGTTNEKKIKEVEDKARIIGYARLIRRSIRRHGLETEEGRREIDIWKNAMTELLETTDSLLFLRNELEIEALNENLPIVNDFVEKHLETVNCPMKAHMEILLAVEEIFVNIANYAYEPEKGNAVVRVEFSEDPVTVVITFIDQGIPYNPLEREDPDIHQAAEDRDIGGLGVFLIKNTMDDVTYEYKNGQNILQVKKNVED